MGPSAVSNHRGLELIARKVLTAKKIITLGLYRVCSQWDFSWRYIANLRPWLQYQRIRKPLSAVKVRLLADLRRDGIVITSVGEMMGNTSLFEELEASVWKYEAFLADEINKVRTNEINKTRGTFSAPGDPKTYVFRLLGGRPALDPNDIFARFALHPEVLAIANAYFGMLTKLRAYQVWHNVSTTEEPRESQLWHRDPEDRSVLKMFVYLTAVDECSGPFSYVRGTHAQGCVKAVPESTLYREGRSNVRRSVDSQMNASIPKEGWITATGPKGTVVLADTRGYHKGGLVREHDRIVYVCTFTSKASTLSEDFFKRRLPIPTYLDKSVEFAIEE